MDAQALIQSQLRDRLAEARVRNPTFSVRAFARKLGISSGALSTILNGKRRISLKMALRLADRLGLDPRKTHALSASFNKRGQVLPAALQLTADQYTLIAEWQHFAILNLTELKSFKNSPAWISARLGISQHEARNAVSRLIRLGLLTQSGSRLERAQARVATSDGVPNTALRRAHAKNLELAGRSLEQDAIELRDFSAMTFPADPARLHQARKIIREAQERVVALMDTTKATEVYKVCTQIFPLTQGESS